MEIVKVLNALDYEDTKQLRNTGTIIIPIDVDEIGVGVFSHALNLREIIIPKNVKKIENRAFYGCHNLKIIKLCSVIDIDDNAFLNCDNLEKIILDENVLKELRYTPTKIEKYSNYLKEVTNKKVNITVEDEYADQDEKE